MLNAFAKKEACYRRWRGGGRGVAERGAGKKAEERSIFVVLKKLKKIIKKF